MSMVLGASIIVPNMLPLYSQTVSANTQNTGILSAKDRGILYANSRTDFRDETIYFLITTRFYDGESNNNARTSEDKKANNPESDPSWRGDFAGLIEQLDYIKALGFTAIWITPVVQNNSGYDYHGYHASNFNAVDYRYESNGVDYQTLIDAVHAKGMKIIQDVVFNHTSNFGEEGLNELGGSVGVLKAMGALNMGLTEDELQPLVSSWRESNPAIINLWWDVDKAVKDCIKQRSKTETHDIKFEYKSGFLFIHLLSGRKLAYVKPAIGENRFGGESVTYEGVGATKKWERLESSGPKFVENIVQAMARDILCFSMSNLRQFDIVGSVHNEGHL